MTTPACESKWHCQLNGLFNTAALVTGIALVWGTVEMLIASSGMARFALAMAVPLASVLYAVTLRARHRTPGWGGLGFVFGAMGWAIYAMNTMVQS
ncbi:hypothetical protein [Shimia sp. SDUM112013]|uniref:hypothetical protein n=1 Tax=Shimia sp. SDUM112013 TaxID=3136160 RepID=UPI0032EE8BC4